MSPQTDPNTGRKVAPTGYLWLLKPANRPSFTAKSRNDSWQGKCRLMPAWKARQEAAQRKAAVVSR